MEMKEGADTTVNPKKHTKFRILNISTQLGVPNECPLNISRERDDDYAKIVLVSHSWRMIICRDDRQWILQQRRGKRVAELGWKSISYCTTRKALIRLWHEKTGTQCSALGQLPKTFGGNL